MKNFPVQYILFLLLLSHLGLFAQNHVPVVTNVDLQQRTDYTLIVDIYYDVFDADEDTMTVTMFASSDSGATWNLTCNNITGAIGSGITNGTGKHIIWNIGVEHPNFFSNKVMIEIAADDGIPSAPVLVSPLNNSIILTFAPTLSWMASATTTSYTLQVSESNLFTSYVYNQSGLTGISQQVSSLSDSTIYYWRVIAANNYGTNPSIAWSFSTAPQPCPGLPTVTYSGKTYNTVQVGIQCWLRENLDVGTMIISSTSADSMRNNGIIEKYCHANDAASCNTYGGLYQWREAMGFSQEEGTQGICPTGWHIPTTAEFAALIAAVNNDGNSLKAIGQGTSSGQGTNSSGFSALLAGRRGIDGNFSDLGVAHFWGSTEGSSNSASSLALNFSISHIYLVSEGQDYGYSVRCAKD